MEALGPHTDRGMVAHDLHVILNRNLRNGKLRGGWREEHAGALVARGADEEADRK
jgi:hypothetical protein